jgi:hypothetical protein
VAYQDIYIDRVVVKRHHNNNETITRLKRTTACLFYLFNSIRINVGKSSLEMQRASVVLFYLKTRNLNLNAPARSCLDAAWDERLLEQNWTIGQLEQIFFAGEIFLRLLLNVLLKQQKKPNNLFRNLNLNDSICSRNANN